MDALNNAVSWWHLNVKVFILMINIIFGSYRYERYSARPSGEHPVAGEGTSGTCGTSQAGSASPTSWTTPAPSVLSGGERV
jgi:hypothetical protein